MLRSESSIREKGFLHVLSSFSVFWKDKNEGKKKTGKEFLGYRHAITKYRLHRQCSSVARVGVTEIVALIAAKGDTVT